MNESDEESSWMIVPWTRLSAEALRGVIEEYVTREGTEYGFEEVPLEKKVAQVKRQLERGEVVVLFDAKTETVNLASASELDRAGLRSSERARRGSA